MQVFGEAVLDRMWNEEGDDPEAFRRAFCRWGAAILARYDEVAALPLVGRNERGQIDPTTRAAIKQMHGGGVTIRHLAELHGLTLRQVTSAIWKGNAGRRAAAYIALEEELVSRGSPNNWGVLNQKHGFGASSRIAQKLAEKHGLPKTNKQRNGAPRRVVAT
jgi:hypothetical protein